jgi:hypothetical protein
MTSKSLQDRKIRNLALMALWRYLIASSKGNSGFVGGKYASLLEFSKLSAVPRREDCGMFVTVIFLRLKPVGGANANFEAELEGRGKISNLVGARRSCKPLPFSMPQEHSRRTIPYSCGFRKHQSCV